MLLMMKRQKASTIYATILLMVSELLEKLILKDYLFSLQNIKMEKSLNKILCFNLVMAQIELQRYLLCEYLHENARCN